MQSSAIFPLFYLPPVGYFSALKAHNFNFVLEKQEHFPKQTYRNRTSIASPDGTLDLIIPVVKGAKVHTALKDVKISYDTRWQRLHWLSLQNCYRSSAYFEFYEDGLRPFYERKFDFLYDYNLELLHWLGKQLKIDLAITETQSYEKEWVGLMDYRNRMTKKEVPQQETKSYFQVFSDRNEFIPNLSMVDLLFSQGPQSKTYF
ncbi:WbqC family protein [Pedobacter sp. KR3-3]|uniref:WbqC family protein n=1 Tax=Pedobacter albus TaxID=3113905 RepID=A0ABU7I4A5_9SPHI|nr:WbqC family protein [Pedobacter sp. KR3-3]MEE1944293.1 WbqC family protein [Pedobacter sp. KR3-3]